MLLLIGTTCLLTGLRIFVFSVRDGLVRRRIKKNARGDMATGAAAGWLGVLFILLSLLPISGGIIGLAAAWVEFKAK